MPTLDVSEHLKMLATDALKEASSLPPADARVWFENLHEAEKKYFREFHPKAYLMILEKIVQPQEASNDVRV